MNSNSWKFFIVVSISIVFVLLVFTLYKIYNVEQKVFNTNKFVFELLTDKKVSEISSVESDDIVIGDSLAPVTMVVYTKYKCPYCEEFFKTTYPHLKTKYVDNGILKLVIRYIISPNNEVGYLVAKSSYYAYRNGIFQDFNTDLIHSYFDNISSESLNDYFTNKNVGKEFKEFNSRSEIDLILKRKVLEASSAGIFRTPTFIVNEQLYLGDKKDNFDEIIVNALNSLSCL